MYSYNEPATSKTYTLSLHDALPIFEVFTRKIVSENPATGEQLYEFDCASDDEVWTAVERAKLAQPGWNAIGVEKRVTYLKKFQSLLLDRKKDISEAITREAGKPYAEALLTEVLVVLDTTRFLIDTAYGFLRDQPVPHGNLAMKA